MNHIESLRLLDCRNRTHACGFWEVHWLMPCLLQLMSQLVSFLPDSSTPKAEVSNNRVRRMINIEPVV